MRVLSYIFVLFLLSSCFKEEDKRPVNNEASASIVLGSEYSKQVFYNLNTQTIVSQNDFDIWDLAFYSNEDEYHIKLNYAAIKMKAYNTGKTDFNEITAMNDNWTERMDDPSGDLTNLAIDVHFETGTNDSIVTGGYVYVLKMGVNALGQSVGFKKFVVKYVLNNKYYIRYSDLDGENEQNFVISKDATLNYVYFSFSDNGSMVTVEPDKSTWDLLFTRSTDKAISINQNDTIDDYTVTSVLINPFYTETYNIENSDYDNITINDVDNSLFSNQLNLIGYDWKELFDYGTVVYEIKEDNYYIIKDVNSIYYKLKFLSFYDPITNEKGTISFDYKIIQ